MPTTCPVCQGQAYFVLVKHFQDTYLKMNAGADQAKKFFNQTREEVRNEYITTAAYYLGDKNRDQEECWRLATKEVDYLYRFYNVTCSCDDGQIYNREEMGELQDQWEREADEW